MFVDVRLNASWFSARHFCTSRTFSKPFLSRSIWSNHSRSCCWFTAAIAPRGPGKADGNADASERRPAASGRTSSGSVGQPRAARPTSLSLPPART